MSELVPVCELCEALAKPAAAANANADANANAKPAAIAAIAASAPRANIAAVAN